MDIIDVLINSVDIKDLKAGDIVKMLPLIPLNGFSEMSVAWVENSQVHFRRPFILHGGLYSEDFDAPIALHTTYQVIREVSVPDFWRNNRDEFANLADLEDYLTYFNLYTKRD